MKFLRSLCLIATLAIGSITSGQAPAPKSVGYDIGVCSPDVFVAFHIEVVNEKTITITSISPGPHRVEKVDSTVYEFAKSDKDGKHYVFVNDEHSKMDLVVSNIDDKSITAEITDNGEVVGEISGVSGDGSNLADNAIKAYRACRNIKDDDPKISKS